MRLLKHQHLYQLTFMPRLFPVNCYLIEEKDGLTLVDAAMASSAAAILSAAETIGKPIRKIVLTHAHSDHIGALDKLKESLHYAEVFMAETEWKLLSGEFTLKANDPPLKGGFPKNIKTKPDRFLLEGDRIDSLEVIAAPGHSPGMLAFFDHRNGALIAGDSFQLRGGMAVAGDVRWRFPFPAWGTWKKELSVASAQKLIDLKPKLLAVGHGNLLHNPVPKMQQAIQRAKKGLNSHA
ncbi:Glyoxylase, beta-lactamase superfamily II [Terribacillus aidingensis]|uniref:Glyoxylase, beta-lactamase superfamily II n=1 Tax=Terribacillus aidingensis TaxID=586416 RepID=A0A285NQ46_9BACI|nr:MBL fold metallo-hydrolase [Terribacillus aidingensis]SNZ11632.1 Glyoxylase, beta-lactamase superfamily II [Terribacillus aidingensis]